MGSRIKGITLEIDGSTTGLDKAIKRSNQNISSMQKSLKDIERLLKLDPTNTELLSQKQKILSQAVGETKTKLEALKNASEQAAKTVGNYDAWKAKYEPIQQEVDKTKSKLQELKQKQQDLEKAGKIDTEEYKKLQKEIGDTEDDLKKLKEQQKQVDEEFGKPISQEKFDALQREIIETEENLKSLEKQAKNASSVLGTKLQDAGKKVMEAGKAVMGAGKNITTNVSVPLVAAGAASVKMASEFEDAMAKVSTIADSTEVPMEDLEKQILELSNQTGISSTEIANNVYDAISAGQSTGDAVNFVANSTKLAKAGFADAGSALDLLTTTLNAYGMEADQVTNVSDMLIQTQNKGKTTVGELSGAMGKIIPTANAYGVGLDQLCTGYAIMTANGVATAESTTYMNAMLNELGKSGTTVSDILKDKTGSSFEELMKNGYSLSDCLAIVQGAATEQGLSFGDMWSSSEAAKAGLILLGDSAEEFNSTLGEMQNCTGATESAFGKLDTNSTKAKKAVNQLKNTAIDLGGELMDTLAPITEEVCDKIQQFSEWFSNLSPETKEMIVKIAMVVAAIGPLIVVIGTVISSLGGIITGIGILMSSGLLPIIAIIAAVVGIGTLLYKNWDTIKEKAGELKDNISEKWEAFKQKTSEAWENAKETVHEKWEEIKSNTSEEAENIRSKVSGKWEELKENTNSKWQGIQSTIQENGGGIKGVIVTAIKEYGSVWGAGFSEIDSLTGGKLGDALSTVREKTDGIKQAFSDKLEGARAAVDSAIEKIKEKFKFRWSLPELKLPHFNISGEFSLKPPSVPSFSVSWYDKAMENAYLLNGASIFGSMNGNLLGGGESGSEMILGQQYLIDMIQEASARNNADVIRVMSSIGNQMIALMSKYFPECAKQKVAIPERTLGRSLRDMGVVFE